MLPKKYLFFVLSFLFFLPAKNRLLYGQTSDSVYTFTDGLQYFTVPANTYCLKAKMWGASGSGPYGGAGGYSEALFSVNPGDLLTVLVGGSNGFGGGGAGILGGYVAGGRSAIINGTNEIIDAGGGGGSGTTAHIHAGAGGGCVGQSGHGSGGTQTTGGTAGGGCGSLPYIGSAYQGGNGCNSGSIHGGGGGGGGYYGGGGGGAGTNMGTGGGGGSGHVPIGGTTITGNLGTPPNIGDPDYLAGIAVGGGSAGNGLVIIYWGVPCLIPEDTINDVSICKGDSITLATYQGVSYSWFPSDDLSSTSIHNPVAGPDTTTAYLIQVTDNNGCIRIDTILVTVLPPPALTISGIAEICPGNSTTLNVFGALNYIWQPGGQIGSTISVTPANTASYTITGTDTNSCSNTDSITVIVNPLPIPDFSSTIACLNQNTLFNDSSTVAGSAISGWTWNFGDQSLTNLTQNPSHMYNTCGSFSAGLIVTDTNGCIDSVIKVVTVNCLPIVFAGNDDSVCFGETYTLMVAPNGTGFTYLWSENSNPNFSADYNPLVAPVANTTYTVTLSDSSGCVNTDSIAIFADLQIQLQPTVLNTACNTSCDGQVSISVVGGTPPYQYAWSASCTGTSCNNLCAGTYSVTVTDSWGCNASADTIVTEPTPLLAFINSFTPADCNTACNGSAAITASGGTTGSGYIYLWNSTPAQSVSSADSLCPGSYICSVTDANGCTAQDTVIITSPPSISVFVTTSPTDCNDSTGKATASVLGGTPGYSYLWNPGGQTVQSASGLSALTYTIVITDANGCTASQTASVNTVAGPTVIVTATNSNIMAGNTTTLSASATGNFQWSPGSSLNCDTCQSPVASPLETITYCVIVTDTNNCVDSGCVTIEVEFPCELTVPNAFSPNNDGKNDVLTLHGWDKCVTTFSMIIFNRWGEKIFESDNPLKTWDGNYKSGGKDIGNNNPLNSAVFVYYIKATLFSGEEITRQGNISVIR